MSIKSEYLLNLEQINIHNQNLVITKLRFLKKYSLIHRKKASFNEYSKNKKSKEHHDK